MMNIVSITRLPFEKEPKLFGKNKAFNNKEGKDLLSNTLVGFNKKRVCEWRYLNCYESKNCFALG